jgi:hypothetical protein
MVEKLILLTRQIRRQKFNTFEATATKHIINWHIY